MRPTTLRFVASRIGMLLASGVASPLLAGNLAPPAGPITPTMKTLDEIEPRTPIGFDTTPGNVDALFIISAPGSYYLTSNIFSLANRHGILITSGDVTLDLNGFLLSGSSAGLSGVIAPDGLENVRVKNGFLGFWTEHGVHLGEPGGETPTSGYHVENVHSANCTAGGIFVSNDSSVTRCSSRGSGGIGIETGDGAVVTGCLARQNMGNGIEVGDHCIVRECIALGNKQHGIQTDNSCHVSHSSAYINALNGFVIGIGCVATDSQALGNINHGITMADSGTIRRCQALFNFGRGLSIGSHCVVDLNDVRTNLEGGIVAQSRCSITRNRAVSNSFNAGGGIVVEGSVSWIHGNEVADNTMGGIIVPGSFNLITSNHSVGQGPTDDFIIAPAMSNRSGTERNAAAGAGAWDNFILP